MEELREVCGHLTSEVNLAGAQVHRDEGGVMRLTEDVSSQSVRAMEKAALQYDCLQGYYPPAERAGVFLDPVRPEADGDLLALSPSRPTTTGI